MKSKPSAASRGAYQHDMHVEPSNLAEPMDHSDSGTIYGGIDMPANKFYRVHTTNFQKAPPVGSLTPRKHSSTSKSGPPKPQRHKGLMFLPSHIYKMLSDSAFKALK